MEENSNTDGVIGPCFYNYFEDEPTSYPDSKENSINIVNNASDVLYSCFDDYIEGEEMYEIW